jgi:hypothetical protein
MLGTLDSLGQEKPAIAQPLTFGTLASKNIYKFFSMWKGATVPRVSALLGQECNSAANSVAGDFGQECGSRFGSVRRTMARRGHVA